MKRRFQGFTLIELLIVVAIIAILAAIAVPNFLEAQVRSKVSRVHADERTYATAIEAYYVDYNDYPPSIYVSGGGGGPVSPSQIGNIGLTELEEALLPLSTPVAFLSTALLEEPFNGKQGWILYEGWQVIDQSGGPPDAGQRKAIYLYVALPSESVTSNPLVVNYIQSLIQTYVPAGITITAGDIQDVIAKRWFVVSPGPDTFYSFDRCMVDVDYNAGSITDCIFKEIADAAIEKIAGIYDPTNGTVSKGEIVRTAKGITRPTK